MNLLINTLLNSYTLKFIHFKIHTLLKLAIKIESGFVLFLVG